MRDEFAYFRMVFRENMIMFDGKCSSLFLSVYVRCECLLKMCVGVTCLVRFFLFKLIIRLYFHSFFSPSFLLFSLDFLFDPKNNRQPSEKSPPSASSSDYVYVESAGGPIHIQHIDSFSAIVYVGVWCVFDILSPNGMS